MYATETMRKVYLIAVLALIAGLSGLVLWYQHFGAPNRIIAGLIPGTNVRPAQTLIFAVIGDNEGSNPAYDDLIRQIAADPNIQFLVHVGDATSTGSATELQDLAALHATLGLAVPVYMVLGNHDIKAEDAAQAWSKNVGERWRSVDIGNVHLVLLDNANRKVGFPAEELTWLEQDLASLQTRQSANPGDAAMERWLLGASRLLGRELHRLGN